MATSSSDIRHLILGCDPGISGAMAWYDTAAKALVDVIDMPLTIRQSRKEKSWIDEPSLAAMVEILAPATRLAIIEKVGARPGQGVTSMFRFGYAAGLVAGVVSSFRIPVHYSASGVWKSIMGVRADKGTSVDLARKLFPTHADKFTRSKDGRAEAALLAIFGATRFLTPKGAL